MRAGKRYGRVIELLVVIAIIPMILIILAVALPGVTNDGRYAREMAAAKAIATIHTAESQYYSRYGRYATSLALLGPPASGSPGPGRPRVNRPGSGFGRKGRLQIRLAADSDRLRLIGHSHRLRPFRHAHLLFGLEARRSAARNWPSPTMACRRNPASKCATRPSSDRFRAATGCFTPRALGNVSKLTSDGTWIFGELPHGDAPSGRSDANSAEIAGFSACEILFRRFRLARGPEEPSKKVRVSPPLSRR